MEISQTLEFVIRLAAASSAAASSSSRRTIIWLDATNLFSCKDYANLLAHFESTPQVERESLE